MLRSHRLILVALILLLSLKSVAGQPPVDPDVITAQNIQFLAEKYKIKESGLHTVRYSPDSQIIAGISRKHYVAFWDSATGVPVRYIPTMRSQAVSLRFSPDGRWLAVGSNNPTGEPPEIEYWEDGPHTVYHDKDYVIEVRNLESGGEALVFDAYTSMELRANDQFIGWKVFEGDAKRDIWDLNTGHIVGTDPYGELYYGFSPDGTYAYENLQEGLRIIDPLTQTPLGTLPSSYSISFSDDDSSLAAYNLNSESSEIFLWDLKTFTLKRTLTLDPPHYIEQVAYSPNGKTVAARMSSYNSITGLWNAETGALIKSWESLASDLLYNRDGSVLVVVSLTGLLFIDTATGARLRYEPINTYSLESLQFSPDGKTLAAITGTGLTVWGISQMNQTCTSPLVPLTPSNIEQARPIQQFETTSSLGHIAYSPDGRLIVGGGFDAAVRAWDTVTGDVSKTYRWSTGPDEVGAMTTSYTIDGHFLVAAGPYSWGAQIWDITTGDFIRTIENAEVALYNPDGHTLITLERTDDGIRSYTLRLWDANTGDLLKSFERETFVAEPLMRISPDGHLLVVVPSTGSDVADLWDLVTGEFLYTVPMPQHYRVSDVEFSPDGPTLAIAASGSQHILHLWDLDTRTFTHTYDRPDSDTSGVTSMAFSSDGRILLVGSYAHSLSTWNAMSDDVFYVDVGDRDDVVFAPDGRSYAALSYSISARYGEYNVISIWGVCGA